MHLDTHLNKTRRIISEVLDHLRENNYVIMKVVDGNYFMPNVRDAEYDSDPTLIVQFVTATFLESKIFLKDLDFREDLTIYIEPSRDPLKAIYDLSATSTAARQKGWKLVDDVLSGWETQRSYPEVSDTGRGHQLEGVHVMLHGNPYLRAATQGNSDIGEPFIPWLTADMRHDELEQSLRRFLGGALHANEDAKATTANLAEYGQKIEVLSNFDAICVAYKTWSDLLVQSIYQKVTGTMPKIVLQQDKEALFTQTELPETIPRNPTPAHLVGLAEQINDADIKGDLLKQIRLLENLIQPASFERLEGNIRVFQDELTRQK